MLDHASQGRNGKAPQGQGTSRCSIPRRRCGDTVGTASPPPTPHDKLGDSSWRFFNLRLYFASVERLAKIVATIGPASDSVKTFAQLLDAGLDVVRLNLSHGNHEHHRQVIQTVRRVTRERGQFVPIIVDLMGPRYRLGTLEPMELEVGDQVHLGDSSVDVDLPVEDSAFLGHLKVGERILIDNGRVEIEIEHKEEHRVRARVLHGGPVSTRKGINLPDTELPFVISDKDRADIAFALEEEADYIAVSFVGGPDDLQAIREVLRQSGGMLPLISKLERKKAMSRLAETVQASDAVMVARGDLGVEVPLHQVPVMQKRIIATGRRFGKPVIVATQMLESMMEQPRPTRAEASDCANAVFDGADALMLSGETAAGAYPVAAVETMARIIVEAESYGSSKAAQRQRGRQDIVDLPDRSPSHIVPGAMEEPQFNKAFQQQLEIPDVVCAAAVQAANRLHAERIVAFSQGGFTARMIARYRPQTPITVFTRERAVARRVQLVWGARPLLIEHDVDHHDEVVSLVDHSLFENGLAQPGDVIVILMGDPIAERPLTNLLRVHRIGPG